MSLNSNAIIFGHQNVDVIVSIIERRAMSKKTQVRDMHRDDYKVIEFITDKGRGDSVDVFLNSYAAEDYSSVFQGDSTFLTVAYSPDNYELLCEITEALGGLVQKTSDEKWISRG